MPEELLGESPADPPDAGRHEDKCECKEDAAFDGLECPEAACGLVDGGLEHAVAAKTGADALQAARVGLGDAA